MKLLCILFAVLIAPTSSPPESTGTPSRTVSPALSPTCEDLAKHVREVLEETRYLRFEERVQQGGIKPGGEAALFREVVHSSAWMCPKRLRMEVRLAGERDPVFTLVDDGERVTQWSDDEWYKEPSTVPNLERDQYVARERVDGCMFGGLMSSWVGERAYQSQSFFQRISEGSYIGIDSVEARPCHVVLNEWSAPDSLFKVRHWYYIDVERSLVLRWKTDQVTYDTRGRMVQDITRIRTFHDVRAEEFPENLLRAQPPPAARRVARPTPLSGSAEVNPAAPPAERNDGAPESPGEAEPRP